MTDEILIRKIRDKISKNENVLQNHMSKVQSLWEDTGLDPKDSSYLIEKTMRFEMAQAMIDKAFLLFKETIEDYKELAAELERSD